MRSVVVTGYPRADQREIEMLAEFGVATVHEAIGRAGYLGPAIRPVYLHAMGFPVFSAAVSAQGTVKATARAVNIPISINGQLIAPGEYLDYHDAGAP